MPHSIATMAIRDVLKTLLVLLGITEALGSCSNLTFFSTQMDALLSEYDRHQQPTTPARVTIRLDVRHATVLEPGAAVRLLADLHLSWLDSRLSWNASEWNCERALVSSERLWLPDVVLLNAATGGAAGETGLRAHLASDGAVGWVTRLDLTAPISMDLTDWPADVHDAVFKFGSRSHSMDEMEIEVNITKSLVFGSSSWRAVAVNAVVQTWQGVDQQRAVAAWTVRLRREGGAHALAAGAVLTAAAMLLVAAALLPPDCRSALCAAAAFTSALWLVSSAARVSESARVPFVLVLVCVQCASACACAVAAALVRRVALCSAPPPHLLRTLLTAASLHCRLTPTESGAGESNAWAAAAQLLDRTLLVLVVVTATGAFLVYL